MGMRGAGGKELAVGYVFGRTAGEVMCHFT